MDSESPSAPAMRHHTAHHAIVPGGDREWAYLSTPAYQTRYILAAAYLEHCPDIVEIGGYRTPISGFLRGPHRSVTVIDPHIVPLQADTLAGHPCRVRHLPNFFQDVPDLPTEYGLALLGLDFELYELTRATRRKVLEQFTPIVRNATRIVMEIPRDWPASRWLGDWIEATTGYKKTLQFTLDLKGDLGVDLSRSWPPIWRRTMVILDR